MSVKRTIRLISKNGWYEAEATLPSPSSRIITHVGTGRAIQQSWTKLRKDALAKASELDEEVPSARLVKGLEDGSIVGPGEQMKIELRIAFGLPS
jgi:hypothetical protein